jgi:hypothetical protein
MKLKFDKQKHVYLCVFIFLMVFGLSCNNKKSSIKNNELSQENHNHSHIHDDEEHTHDKEGNIILSESAKRNNIENNINTLQSADTIIDVKKISGNSEDYYDNEEPYEAILKVDTTPKFVKGDKFKTIKVLNAENKTVYIPANRKTTKLVVITALSSEYLSDFLFVLDTVAIKHPECDLSVLQMDYTVEETNDFLKNKKFNYPILTLESAEFSSLNTSYLPIMFFLDSNNKVKHMDDGSNGNMFYEEIKKFLNSN